MPENKDTQKIPEGVEVSEDVMKRGTVQFMTKSALTNPAPEKLKRVIKALNYFCAGIVAAVGATDLFSGGQAKVICFIVGIFVLALGSLEISIGVKADQ